jgi:hypothetical protein
MAARQASFCTISFIRQGYAWKLKQALPFANGRFPHDRPKRFDSRHIADYRKKT